MSVVWSARYFTSTSMYIYRMSASTTSSTKAIFNAITLFSDKLFIIDLFVDYVASVHCVTTMSYAGGVTPHFSACSVSQPHQFKFLGSVPAAPLTLHTRIICNFKWRWYNYDHTNHKSPMQCPRGGTTLFLIEFHCDDVCLAGSLPRPCHDKLWACRKFITDCLASSMCFAQGIYNG